MITMLGSPLRSALLGVALAALAACNMASVRDEPLDAGESRSFDAPNDKVVQATLGGLRGLRLDVTGTSEEPEAFVILFVRRTGLTQWGAVGRVIVDKSSLSPTTVHVKYRRRLPLSGAAGEERISRLLFTRIDEDLRSSAAK